MSSAADGALSDLLLGLERRLMDPEFRKNREQVAGLLTEDFREFGASGRIWNKTEIVDLLAGESPRPAPEIEEFAIQILAPEAVLTTYRAVRTSFESSAPQATLRSSIWVKREDWWQIVFHQGTKISRA